MLRSLIQQTIHKRTYNTARSEKPLYFVSRTTTNGLPVYHDYKNGRTRELTVIRRIKGDAEALKKDLLTNQFPDAPADFATVVPRTNQVILKGLHSRQVKEWLIEKGF